MKKAAIDSAQPVDKQLAALRENVEILTGRRGGSIDRATAIGGTTYAPSSGVFVAEEFNQVLRRLTNLETKLNTLIDRMNTP